LDGDPSSKVSSVGQDWWTQAEFGSGKSQPLSSIGALGLGDRKGWEMVQDLESKNKRSKRECRRAGLSERGRAIYEKGGPNLANLTEEEHIEAEDDYRICVRRGGSEEAKPKLRRRKMKEDNE